MRATHDASDAMGVLGSTEEMITVTETRDVVFLNTIGEDVVFLNTIGVVVLHLSLLLFGACDAPAKHLRRNSSRNERIVTGGEGSALEDFPESSPGPLLVAQ